MGGGRRRRRHERAEEQAQAASRQQLQLHLESWLTAQAGAHAPPPPESAPHEASCCNSSCHTMYTRPGRVPNNSHPPPLLSARHPPPSSRACSCLCRPTRRLACRRPTSRAAACAAARPRTCAARWRSWRERPAGRQTTWWGREPTRWGGPRLSCPAVLLCCAKQHRHVQRRRLGLGLGLRALAPACPVPFPSLVVLNLGRPLGTPPRPPGITAGGGDVWRGRRGAAGIAAGGARVQARCRRGGCGCRGRAGRAQAAGGGAAGKLCRGAGSTALRRLWSGAESVHVCIVCMRVCVVGGWGVGATDEKLRS